MAWRAALLALLAAAPTAALRKRRSTGSPPGSTVSGQPRLTVGQKGTVSGIYSYGAPAGTSPGLSNPLDSNGCFPGLRVVAARKQRWFFDQVDPVPPLATPFGFRHPRMLQAKAFVDAEPEYDVKWGGCGDSWPEREIVEPFLHARGMTYVDKVSKFDIGALPRMVLKVAINISSNSDREAVAESVGNFGWNLIGSAQVDDPISFLTDTISHLLQEPASKSCILTFRGSKSIEDWVHNAQIVKAAFCGWVEEDEKCDSWVSECEARKPHGAFIHRGFRDHFRKLFNGKEWKENIMPNLPGCAEVMAVGHSLGGTVASFFARCLADPPQPGEFGHEDYAALEWTAGEPRLLTPWNSSGAGK